MPDAKVVFETASIQSAITNAARVAPTKGHAFDITAGIVVEVDENAAHPVTVKATNLEVDYLEWVTPIEVTGKTTWRMPSTLLAGLMGNLPIGSAHKTTFLSEGDNVRITSGKTRARLNTMQVGSFKVWEPYDSSGMKLVEGFGARVSQVSWAVHKDLIPATGIHINGNYLAASDRIVLAKVPLSVPVDEPVTVPMDVITPILRSVTDARIAVEDKTLRLMPDDHTQITCVIYAAKYLPVDSVLARWTEYQHQVSMGRAALLDAISRMLVLVRGERYPRLVLTSTGDAFKLFMNVPGVGEVEDEIAASGTPHEPVELLLNPTYLVSALSGTSVPEVHISYSPFTTDPAAQRPFHIFDDEGYESWVQVVTPSATGSGP